MKWRFKTAMRVTRFTAAFGLLPSIYGISKRVQLRTKSLHPWHNFLIFMALLHVVS